MPDSTIFVVELNILPREVPGRGLLNMLLFPKNFKKHVRPGIAPPVTMFLAALPPKRVSPDPGITVPVMGLAIQLSDPSVVDELDRIVKGLHFLATASQLDLAKGLFGVDRIERDGLRYHVAQFGPAIQSRVRDRDFRRLANLPSSAGLTAVTFGPVGNYYLICTQEAFFHDVGRALRDPDFRLTATSAFDALALQPRAQLVASMMTRAPEMSALLSEVADYWNRAKEKAHKDGIAESRNDDATRREQKQRGAMDGIEQPLRWIAEGLEHRRSFSMQLWQDQSHRLRGRLSIPDTDAHRASDQP